MADDGSGLRGKLPLRDEWLCAVLNVMLSGRVAVAAAWLRGVVCAVGPGSCVGLSGQLAVLLGRGGALYCLFCWPCRLAVVVRYAVGPGSCVM